MFPRLVALWLFPLIVACAGASRNSAPTVLVTEANSPGLFIGHSQSGDVVVAASHYDAMHGLAVTATDLGLNPRQGSSGQMLCERDLITGTHVPRWICRYKEDVERQRQQTQAELTVPRLSFSRSGGMPTLSASRGGGSPQQ